MLQGAARVAGGTGSLAWLAARGGTGFFGFGVFHLLLVQADPLVDCAVRLAVAAWWLGRWCSRCLLVCKLESKGARESARAPAREDVGECASGWGA